MILKINHTLFLSLFGLLFYSCNGRKNNCKICALKFKKIEQMVYASVGNLTEDTYDSSISLIDQCLNCDSLRIALIDFKLKLLITKKKFKEGVEFVDLLREADFNYNFEKYIFHGIFKALIFDSQNDTTQRNGVYKDMVAYLEKYIMNKPINGKEFEEACMDLFNFLEKFSDASKINQEVDLLESKFPLKKHFLEFFKRT